jgi:hypothetical protein
VPIRWTQTATECPDDCRDVMSASADSDGRAVCATSNHSSQALSAASWASKRCRDHEARYRRATSEILSRTCEGCSRLRRYPYQPMAHRSSPVPCVPTATLRSRVLRGHNRTSSKSGRIRTSLFTKWAMRGVTPKEIPGLSFGLHPGGA